MKVSSVFSFLAAVLVTSCGGSQQAPAGGGPSGSKSAVGGGCASDGDCQAGLTCDKGDPGGQCQKACTATTDCGAGAVCGESKKCYKACQSKADCRDGYTCMGKAPAMFCDVAEEGPH